MNDYTLYLVKKAYYKKQLIKRAADEDIYDKEWLADVKATELQERADAQRDFILGTSRAEGMTLGGAVGGSLGAAGGYYGGRALARKWGLDDKSWKSKALRYGGATLGTAGGLYLGGKLGHKGTKAMQDKLFKRYDYGTGRGADYTALRIANLGNELYEKYNI